MALPGRSTVSRRLRVTGMNLERTGRSSARNGRQVLGRRLRRFDERFEVVEGGAEVDEGRVGLAHERRQLAQGLVEGDVLGGDRVEGGVGVGDRAGERFAALGDRGRQLGGADDEALEQALVGVQFLDEGVGAVERRAEVLEGLVGVLALARVRSRCP